MKKALLTLSLLAFLGTAFAEAETKQVCHDKLDKQGKPVKKADGKVVQDCKTIKVHKKLEGAIAVPVKK
jgi:hypothetical protein